MHVAVVMLCTPLTINFTVLPKTLNKRSKADFTVIRFVLYFHLLLIGSFIRIWSFFFVSWSLIQKLKHGHFNDRYSVTSARSIFATHPPPLAAVDNFSVILVACLLPRQSRTFSIKYIRGEVMSICSKDILLMQRNL